MATKTTKKADLLLGMDKFFWIKGKKLYLFRGWEVEDLNYYVNEKLALLAIRFGYEYFSSQEKAWGAFRRRELRKLIKTQYRMDRESVFVPYAERDNVPADIAAAIGEMMEYYGLQKLWCDKHLWIDKKHSAIRCTIEKVHETKQDPAARQHFDKGFCIQLVIAQ